MNNGQYEKEQSIQLVNTATKKYPKRYYVYIPKNLDLDALVSTNPPSIRRFHKDKLAYIISLIYAIPMRLKDYDFEQEKGYVPLHSEVLKSRVREYSEYRKYLVDSGILKKRSDFKYKAGEKASGYRFTETYNVDFKRHIITWKRLIKAICTQHSKGDNIYIDVSNNKLEYLEIWWNEKLQFDYYGAKRWLLNLYHKEQEAQIPHCKRKYFSRKLVIEKFRNMDYIIHQDSTSGRVHTLLTQLKSELRQFITYDDEKLISIDIKNSQPYLSSVLLNFTAFNNNKLNDKINIYNNRTNINSSIMLTLLNKEGKLPKDVNRFIKLVSKGSFYEEFGKSLVKNGLIKPGNPKVLRKKAKKIMFSSMFGHNNEKCKIMDKTTGKIRYIPNEGMLIFKKTFPTVYNIFRLVKQGKHATLACVLQNLEAELVLHNACKIISDERPEIPIFTLHDAIITTEKNALYVKRELSEVLLEAIGIAPTISSEVWDEKMEAA